MESDDHCSAAAAVMTHDPSWQFLIMTSMIRVGCQLRYLRHLALRLKIGTTFIWSVRPCMTHSHRNSRFRVSCSLSFT